MGVVILLMTPEHKLMNEIRRWCGAKNYLCFRTNVGSVLTADGRIFNAGLPVGFPDLMVFNFSGKMLFVECKVYPNRATPQQVLMLNQLNERKFCAFVAWSLEDFVKKHNKAIADGLF